MFGIQQRLITAALFQRQQHHQQGNNDTASVQRRQRIHPAYVIQQMPDALQHSGYTRRGFRSHSFLLLAGGRDAPVRQPALQPGK